MSRYRVYCKNCEDFKIHNEEKICETCETTYEPTVLSEISNEKIQQQRLRFKHQRLRFNNQRLRFNELHSIITSFGQSSGFGVREKPDISESDAGLQEEERAIREEQKRIYQEKIEEISKYKNLQRNEKCSCNSGKKFKKCCLEKVKLLKESL